MDGSKADEGDLGKLRQRSDSCGPEAATPQPPEIGSAPDAAMKMMPPTSTTSNHHATAVER